MADDGNEERREGSPTDDRTRGQPRQGQPQGQPGHGQPGQQRGQQQGQQGRPGPGRPEAGRGGRPGQPARGRRQGGIDLGSLPWVSGAVQGAAYFVTALIAISFVVFVDFVLIASGSGGGGPTGPSSGSGEVLVYLLGWVFYGAHFVNVSVGALGSGNIIDLLGMRGLPSIVYYALPPIFLFLAGRSVARSNGHASMDSDRLAAYGATVVAGYLPLAVVGNYAFTRQGIGPDMATTLLIMGVVYPLVFGGLGGYLADR